MTKTYIFDKKYSTEINFEEGLTWQSTVYGVRIPDITICDPNPWSPDKMQALNVSLETVSYLLYTYNLAPIPRGAKFDRLERQYVRLVKK